MAKSFLSPNAKQYIVTFAITGQRPAIDNILQRAFGDIKFSIEEVGAAHKKYVPEKLTLTMAETAKVLSVGRNTIYKAAKEGQIPTIKIGGVMLVSKSALMKILEGVKYDTSTSC